SIVCILVYCFFFSSRRRHTRFSRDWSSDVCSSDLFKRGGIYYVRDRRGNLDAKRSLRTRSRREARERGREWLKSRDHLFGGERRVTWADAVTTWAGDYLPDAVKPSTAKRYLVSEAQISAFIAAEDRKSVV